MRTLLAATGIAVAAAIVGIGAYAAQSSSLDATAPAASTATATDDDGGRVDRDDRTEPGDDRGRADRPEHLAGPRHPPHHAPHAGPVSGPTRRTGMAAPAVGKRPPARRRTRATARGARCGSLTLASVSRR